MPLCENASMKKSFKRAMLGALAFLIFLPPLVGGDLVLSEGTQISLQLNRDLSTRKNIEGDEFDAVVTDPVMVGDRVVIPKGSVVSGSISRIQRPGRFKGKALMTLLFQSISIPGRVQKLRIVASLTSVDQEGNRGITEGTIEGEGSEKRDIATVLGPAVVGAGIGGLSGGRRGAGVGAGIGAGAGLATVFASRGKEIEMRRGATLGITLDKPLAVSPEEGASARLP